MMIRQDGLRCKTDPVGKHLPCQQSYSESLKGQSRLDITMQHYLSLIQALALAQKASEDMPVQKPNLSHWVR